MVNYETEIGSEISVSLLVYKLSLNYINLSLPSFFLKKNNLIQIIQNNKIS